MKMKKLLSIGAIALVLACSTSIGASAATKPSNEKTKNDMKALFIDNKSPLTYNVDKNTKIGSIIDLEKLQDVINKYDGDVDYDKLNTALDLITKDDTIISSSVKIIAKFNESELDELILEVRSVADRLKEIENGTNTDNVDRIDFEKDMQKVINGKGLKLVFGKNKDGKATMAVMQGYQMILQLNSGNAYTANNFLNNNSDNLTDYAQEIKALLNGNES